MTSSAIRLLDGGTGNRYRNTSTERGIALVFRPQWLSGQAGFRGMKHMPITSQKGSSDAPHGCVSASAQFSTLGIFTIVSSPAATFSCSQSCLTWRCLTLPTPCRSITLWLQTRPSLLLGSTDPLTPLLVCGHSVLLLPL